MENRRVAWHKFSADDIHNKYTLPLERCLTEELVIQCENNDILDAHDIDALTTAITSCMIKCSNTLIGGKNAKHSKPYWIDSLTSRRKATKSLWHLWQEAGRPRGNHPLYVAYKEEKKSI